MLTVSQLIEILYKCSPDAEVMIAVEDESFTGCSVDISNVVEVTGRVISEPSTVYLLHE